jgi:hypothetical protein
MEKQFSNYDGILFTLNLKMNIHNLVSFFTILFQISVAKKGRKKANG